MIEMEIPGWRTLRLEYLLLDVNGTLTRDGVLLPGVEPRLETLRASLHVQLVTADTLGRLDAIAARLGVAGRRLQREIPEAAQKTSLVGELGAGGVAAIGNGANDVDMLRDAGLGIAVIGPEGASTATVMAADVVTTSIEDALDLLLTPTRLIATLRR